MYKHTLRVHGESLIQGEAVPKNTVFNGTSILRAGASMSGVEVLVQANTPVSISAGKSLTLTLQHSQDGSTFIALPGIAKATFAAGANTFEEGDTLLRFTLPSDCLPYIKAAIATDDAAAGGNVNVVLGYLAR